MIFTQYHTVGHLCQFSSLFMLENCWVALLKKRASVRIQQPLPFPLRTVKRAWEQTAKQGISWLASKRLYQAVHQGQGPTPFCRLRN